MVGTKYCCWGECKTDSRYTDKWPKSLKELEESASHKLRIDFRCKGSCKGPYALTALTPFHPYSPYALTALTTLTVPTALTLLYSPYTHIGLLWRFLDFPITFIRGSPGFSTLCMALLFNHYFCFNPLSPKSDQHQFSLNYINTSSIEKVRRINKMITEGEML